MFMNKEKLNYNVFLPLGITFMGAGVVFLTAVNPGIGGAMIGMGVIFIIIGIKKSQENSEKEI